MRHIPTLLRRELASYFLGPMAFLILLAFQAIALVNFWDLVEALARNNLGYSGLRDPLNTYIAGSPQFWIGMLVAIPALTMAQMGHSPVRVEGGLLRDECAALFDQWRAAGGKAY